MADNDNTLSNVLLLQLIYYLPPKSVIRFKSVSKFWNSIISEPNFIPSYIFRNSPPSSFIFERTLNTSSNARFPIQFIFQKPPNLSTLSIDFHKLGPYRLLNHPTLIDSRDELLLVGPEISHWAAGYNFFVINAITNEWVAIPKPRIPILCCSLGLITQIDKNSRVCKQFKIIAYQPNISNNLISFECFSSETAKWEFKLVRYIFGVGVGNHIRRFSARGNLQFNGKMIIIDLNVGLMIWDDPFGSEQIIECRFIRLPLEHVRSHGQTRLDDERRIDICGEHIQYLQVNEHSILSLWRLDNLEEENWNCLYSWDLRQIYPEFWKVSPVLIHPFEDHAAIFRMENTIFCLDLRTGKLKSSAIIVPDMNMHYIPIVLPKWPMFFTPVMRARLLKEHGNQCFNKGRYEVAIDFYTQSIEYTQNVEVYMLRGKTYKEIYKTHEANKDFLKALEIDSYMYKTYRSEEVKRRNKRRISQN